MGRSKILRAYLAGLLAWAVFFALALKFGAVSNADPSLIVELRLPRALMGSAVGLGLAVAGAALQSLFTNPLCDPYTLGISSGAALGAVLGKTLGLQWMFAGLAGTAFAGALVFTALLYVMSRQFGRAGQGSLTLLLAGVMLGFLGSSLVSLWTAIADPNGIQEALPWLLGDLSRARLGGSVFAGAVILVLCFMIWIRWRELDALLMDEEGALSLGIDVAATRRQLTFVTSVLIGVCVSAAGMIGFVGLVVPHFSRRLVGSLHLALLPLCGIWGAASLTAADSLGRVLARPYELPVGIVTALVGAPLFLWIMVGNRVRDRERA